MRKQLRLILAVVLAVIATSVVTAHFAVKNTKTAFVSAAINAEAFNELHRIRSWDSLEKLLVKGCTKEALEYVRMEQSLGLLSLKDSLQNGAKLDRTVEEENSSILHRAISTENQGRYYIPTCN